MLCTTLLCAQTNNFVTYCEQSNFKSTPRYAETMEYCERLAAASPMVKFTNFGLSPQGRQLPLLIVDKDGLFTPESVRRTDKAVMLVEACIHAGEPDGKDAGLMFLRDLLIHKKYPGLLDHVTILFIPIFNVDGHENFSEMNRINQNGPSAIGTRLTAQNINLNRDFLKADALEMQYWIKLYQEWLPELFIDVHVTNGADFQYVTTYAVETNNENMESHVRQWASDVYVKQLVNQMAAVQFPIFPYFDLLNWNDVDSGMLLAVYPPLYSNGYAAAMNRVGLLLENHIYKPYEARVKATYEIIRISMEILNKEHKSIREKIALSDAVVASSAFRKAPMALSHQISTSDSIIVDFMAWDKKVVKSDLTGADWITYDYNKPITKKKGLFDTHKVKEEANLPDAYIIASECRDVIALLDLHHITYTRLTKDSTMKVETYRFTEVEFARRQYESRVTAAPKYTTQTEYVQYPSGSVIVDMNQLRARVAAHLLEPNAPSSLVYWGYFNTYCQPTSEFYVKLGYMEEKGREMLKENPELRKTFEAKKASDASFANNPQAILQFFMTELRKNVEPDAGLYPVGKIYKSGI